MATKDELVAFGQAHGIAVDSSMLKADIEAAISDAGYDPYSLGESTTVETEDTTAEDAAETILRTSSDATHSTYAEVQPDTDIRPAPGRQVEQTRGEPSESAE